MSPEKSARKMRSISDGREARTFLDLLAAQVESTICPSSGGDVEPSKLDLTRLCGALDRIADAEGLPAEVRVEPTPDPPEYGNGEQRLEVLVVCGEWTMYLRYKWRHSLPGRPPIWFLDHRSIRTEEYGRGTST